MTRSDLSLKKAHGSSRDRQLRRDAGANDIREELTLLWLAAGNAGSDLLLSRTCRRVRPIAD